MEKLFKGENHFTDVTIEFIFDSLKIVLSLHRIILFKKSDYFKKLFINGFKSETIHTITLDHVSPYALLDVINEIYDVETNSGDVSDWQRELEMMVCKDYFLIPFDGKKLLGYNIPSDGFYLLEKTSKMIDNIFLKILCHKHDIKVDMPDAMMVAIDCEKCLNVYWINNDELILVNSYYHDHSMLLKEKYYCIHSGHATELRHLITNKLKIKISRYFDKFSESKTSFAYVIDRGDIRVLKNKFINVDENVSSIHYTYDGKYLVCQTSFNMYLYDTENYDLVGKHNYYSEEFHYITISRDNLVGLFSVENKFELIKLPSFELVISIHIDGVKYFHYICYSSKESYLIFIGNNDNIYVYDKDYARISSFPLPIEDLEYFYTIFPHPIDESKIIIPNKHRLYQLDIFTKEVTCFKDLTILSDSSISVFKFP